MVTTTRTVIFLYLATLAFALASCNDGEGPEEPNSYQEQGTCTPSCSAKECGDNGCGGSCGTCTEKGEYCAGGQCVRGEGAECHDGQDCQAGMVCNMYYDECHPPAENGENCWQIEDCKTGLYCADWPMNDSEGFYPGAAEVVNRCFSGENGAPCDKSNLWGAEPYVCAAGLGCVSNQHMHCTSADNAIPTCQQRRGVGGDCCQTEDCAEGLKCNTDGITNLDSPPGFCE